MNDTLFRSEDERAFKQQFVTQFLASWAGVRHAHHYMRGYKSGVHEELKHPPVKDAAYLAQKAWEEWRVMMNAL